MSSTIFSISSLKKHLSLSHFNVTAKMFLLLLSLLLSNTLRAQEAPASASTIELKNGLHLVYDITQGEKAYQYIIDFSSVNDQLVSFSWKMTEPVNKSGIINITANAFATAYNLDFYPASKTFDGEDISMIFGRQVYTQLASFKSGDSVTFGCNSCFREVTTTAVHENSYEVQDSENNLNAINTLKFSSIYNNGNFEVLKDLKFPLIVYFKWKLTIELKSFSYIK